MSKRFEANIKYKGIQCIQESGVDGFLSNSDEVFLTSSFSNLQGKICNHTTKTHTGVDTGEFHPADELMFNSSASISSLFGYEVPVPLTFNEEGITSLAVVMDMWEEDNEELHLNGEYTENFLKGVGKAFNEHTKKDKGLMPENLAKYMSKTFSGLADVYKRINNGFKNDHIAQRHFLMVIDDVKKEITIKDRTVPLSSKVYLTLPFKGDKQNGHHSALFEISIDIPDLNQYEYKAQYIIFE